VDPAVLVGLDTPDDAAVYRISAGLALVQSVDFFTPIVDDATDWGRIAAANAFSDVYAMGGRPVTAMNLVAWPRALDFDILGRVVAGAGEKCAEAGAAVVGGHSIDDAEPKFGLAVTGLIDPERVVRKAGAPPGCDLVLTKPLGMGIISTGIKEGRVSEATIADAIAIMSTLNREAAEAMLETGIAAATDVTGFGLIGHLLQMLGPGTAAELDVEAIPVLPEALDLATAGILPGGSRRNMEALSPQVDIEADVATRAALFDAQTSGGLLIAVARERTQRLLANLRARRVDGATRIGSITAAGPIKVVGA
jgi:selenide,water dikinase